MIEGDGAVSLGQWRHLDFEHVGRQGFVAKERTQLLIDTFHLTLQWTKNVVIFTFVFIGNFITLQIELRICKKRTRLNGDIDFRRTISCIDPLLQHKHHPFCQRFVIVDMLVVSNNCKLLFLPFELWKWNVDLVAIFDIFAVNARHQDQDVYVTWCGASNFKQFFNMTKLGLLGHWYGACFFVS